MMMILVGEDRSSTEIPEIRKIVTGGDSKTQTCLRCGVDNVGQIFWNKGHMGVQRRNYIKILKISKKLKIEGQNFGQF